MAVKPFSYIKDKKRGDYYQIKDPDATRNIGDLTSLDTTAKNNLVAAINEIAGQGGGGGTSDYTDLSNKPSINGITLNGNKSASDLGLGTYSKPSGGIPKTDLAAGVQTSLGLADSALQSVSDVVFWLTYGSSTYAQIRDALLADKILACKYNNLVYIYQKMEPLVHEGEFEFIFTATDEDASVSWIKYNMSTSSWSAASVEVIAAPSSPSVGDFLVYTSNGWAAQSLSVWQGGSY